MRAPVSTPHPNNSASRTRDDHGLRLRDKQASNTPACDPSRPSRPTRPNHPGSLLVVPQPRGRVLAEVLGLCCLESCGGSPSSAKHCRPAALGRRRQEGVARAGRAKHHKRHEAAGLARSHDKRKIASAEWATHWPAKSSQKSTRCMAQTRLMPGHWLSHAKPGKACATPALQPAGVLGANM